MHNFDASALSEPIDRNELRAFKASVAQRFPHSHQGKSSSSIFALIVLSLIGVAMLVAGIVMLAADASLITGGIFTVVGLVFAALGIGTLVVGDSDKRQFRLDRFARANGMQFHPGFNNPKLPGMLFDIGRQRNSQLLVRGDRPRFVEFGNYRYTTGSGKNSTTHTWGYIAVQLDTPLPHLVLDAEGNNSFFGSNLPIGLKKDQRLSLEGNFDEHFSLYAPVGYEADALYLFTPDIMQRFIRNAAQLDVEIVDDWLFFYTGDDVSTLDADRWAWLFSVVGAMLQKIERWGRWRDERLRIASAAPVAGSASDIPAVQNPQMVRPPEGVADPGKRLKRRGAAWTGIIAIVVVVILQVVSRLT